MEKKRKKCEKLKNVLLFCHFTLEIFNGGVFLPITTTPRYSTTVPNSVNDTQDFMCIKFKALLPCKHHPNVKSHIQKVNCTMTSILLTFSINFIIFRKSKTGLLYTHFTAITIL